MTTGRINQVTITRPGTNRGTHPTARRGGICCYQMAEERRSIPSRERITGGTSETRATDSIAPTEYPKGWSAALGFGHEAAHLRCIYPSSGGGPRPFTPFHRRLTVVASPRGSCCRRQQQPGIHRPRRCLLPKTVGLQIPPQAQAHRRSSAWI